MDAFIQELSECKADLGWIIGLARSGKLNEPAARLGELTHRLEDARVMFAEYRGAEEAKRLGTVLVPAVGERPTEGATNRRPTGTAYGRRVKNHATGEANRF